MDSVWTLRAFPGRGGGGGVVEVWWRWRTQPAERLQPAVKCKINTFSDVDVFFLINKLESVVLSDTRGSQRLVTAWRKQKDWRCESRVY